MSPTVITLDRIARALGTDLVIDFEPRTRDVRPRPRPRGEARPDSARPRPGTPPVTGYSARSQTTNTVGSGRREGECGMHYRCPDAQNRCRGARRPHRLGGSVMRFVDPRRQEPGPVQDRVDGEHRLAESEDRSADPDGRRHGCQESGLHPLRAHRRRGYVVADHQRRCVTDRGPAVGFARVADTSRSSTSAGSPTCRATPPA